MEEGDFVVVVGNNGSGKSTLLNTIAGTVVPDRGRVLIGGRDVTAMARVAPGGAGRAGVPESDVRQIAHLTIAENLAVAAKRGGRHGVLRNALGRGRRRELAERVRELGLGLEDRLDTPGRRAVGRPAAGAHPAHGDAGPPQLLLLDEHTSALDPGSTEQVVQLTEQIIRSEGLTTLMVTHSIQQAVALGDRVLIMHRGRIVESIGGARKRQLRVEELLDTFDRLRNADLVDESAAEMVRRLYI